MPVVSPPGSLYIGDLAPAVDDGILWDVFSQVGELQSVKVVRDPRTFRSRGFGFVNFWSMQAAEEAIAELNYASICGMPCRIMWASARFEERNQASNLFVSNLDLSLDTYGLSRMMGVFGEVVSCKVEMDNKGASRGYGFVHFETEEAAEMAMRLANGLMIGDKHIAIEKFVPGEDRQHPGRLVVKRFAPETQPQDLKELFEKVAPVEAVEMKIDWYGQPYANVIAKDAEAGQKMVDHFADQELQVAFARTWKQRKEEADEKEPNGAEPETVDLFVGGLAPTADSAALTALFARFEPTKAVVITYPDGESRGFGFVSFTTAESAAEAIKEMHESTELAAEGGQLVVGMADKRWDSRRKEDKGAGKGKGQWNGDDRPPKPVMPLKPEWNNPGEKRAYGTRLFYRIQQLEANASKLTGVLLESEQAPALVRECLRSDEILQTWIAEAKRILEQKR